MFFKTTPSCSVKEALHAMAEPNSVLIDVRSKGEFSSGHASDALNIPLDTLEGSVISNLAKYDAVYVICQSGGRSSMAVGILTKAGISAINVTGGTSAWQAEGLPMK